MADPIQTLLNGAIRLTSNLKNFFLGIRIMRSGIEWYSRSAGAPEGIGPEALQDHINDAIPRSFLGKFFAYVTSRSFIRSLTFVCVVSSLITASVFSFGAPIIVVAAASVASITYGTTLEYIRIMRLTNLREKTLFLTKLKGLDKEELKKEHPKKDVEHLLIKKDDPNLLIQMPAEPTFKRNFLYWLKYYAESLAAAIFAIPVAIVNPVQTAVVIVSAVISLFTSRNDVHTRKKTEFYYNEAFFVYQKNSFDGVDLNAAFQDKHLRETLNMPIKTTRQMMKEAAGILMNPFKEKLSDISQLERRSALYTVGMVTEPHRKSKLEASEEGLAKVAQPQETSKSGEIQAGLRASSGRNTEREPGSCAEGRLKSSPNENSAERCQAMPKG